MGEAIRRAPSPPAPGPAWARALARGWGGVSMRWHRRLCGLVQRPGVLLLLVLSSATALAVALS